jgi:hypothetical protein
MHGAIPTTTGTLMQISLEQAQLEVGLSIPFLDASFGFYGFLLTDIWWKSVWEFIWRNDIKLTHPDQALPQLQRTNDAFIMERLCLQPGLSQQELLSCNRCRLHYTECLINTNSITDNANDVISGLRR